MKNDENTGRVLVTKNFGQDIDDIMGCVEFNKNSEAYKMLIKHPEKYNFELGYMQNSTDTDEIVLFELSMVRKK